MRALIFFLALIVSGCAYGQSTVLQSGTMTAGHSPMYVNSGNSQSIVQDSGPASGGKAGLGLSEQLLVVRGTGTPPYANQGTGPYKTNWCNYDAPITNATGYHYFCISPNAQGGGLLAYGAGNGAAQLPFTIMVNGHVVTSFTVGTFADNLISTGTTQGTAYLLTAELNGFTSVPANSGALLPTTLASVSIGAGQVVGIINSGLNPIRVYPPSGQTINGQSANAYVTIYMNSDAEFVYRGSGAWYAR